MRAEGISIHAPREGGDVSGSPLIASAVISIHAPREGGDAYAGIGVGRSWISIHAPREGGDVALIHIVDHVRDFNPRPPRGGRRPSE